METDSQSRKIVKRNLLRVSDVNTTAGFPVRASTIYKWRHVGKHLELFVKIGSALFVDLDRLDVLIEAGRLG